MKKKRFSEEQIIVVLREAERGKKSVDDLCKEHGVSVQSFYCRKAKFGGMEAPDVKRLRELAKENARLKRLLAERDLEVDAIKEVLRKNFCRLP